MSNDDDKILVVLKSKNTSPLEGVASCFGCGTAIILSLILPGLAWYIRLRGDDFARSYNEETPFFVVSVIFAFILSTLLARKSVDIFANILITWAIDSIAAFVFQMILWNWHEPIWGQFLFLSFLICYPPSLISASITSLAFRTKKSNK